MKSLDSILSGTIQPGVYRLRSRAQPTSIVSKVCKHGWLGFHVDGREIYNKESLLERFATALSFPDYFGRNWDALEDCLTDLMWLPAPGYVLLYDHVSYFSANNPNDWSVARSILVDSVRYWHSKRKPMYILLRRTGRTAMDIPKI